MLLLAEDNNNALSKLNIELGASRKTSSLGAKLIDLSNRHSVRSLTPADSSIEIPVDLKSLTDEELVARCNQDLEKNLKSYEEIVSRYQDLIYNYSFKLIGDYADAQEITQDVLIRIYNKMSQFQGRSSFKTWLFRIVTNACYSKRRSLASRRTRDDKYDEEAAVQLSASFADPGTGEVSEKLNLAVNRLDESKRAIINFRFVSGLQIEEIAERLGLGLSATKMRLYRALEEVKESYLRIERQDLIT